MNVEVNIRTVSEIIQEENKDNPHLIGGDIRPKISRSVNTCAVCLWMQSQDGIVRVPFLVSSVYTDFERFMFYTAMKEFEVMTCVQFVNRSTEDNYINIVNKLGCWSYVGRIGGAQAVSLSMPSCIKYNLIQHELMHTLGFYHEQTRSDRDNYIDVIWQNISPGNLNIFTLDDGNLQGMPYDLNSIVHYNRYAFSSVSGQPSMVPKGDPTIPMGQALGLSDLDVMKINSLYNCALCRKKLFSPGSFRYDSTSSGQESGICLHLIQSALLVLLQLSDLNVPSSPNCNNAYIKVYDGVSQSSPVLLGKTCGSGSGPVPPLISSGNFFLIEIGNSQPSALSTFTASYETVRYGGTFETDNGVVTSPAFTNPYPKNVDVAYSIIAPEGYKVSLTFYFFSTQYSPNCSIDYLTLLDGPLMTSPILATYCGGLTIPTSVVSSGNVMILHFHSGDSAGHNGFYAKYTFALCRKKFFSPGSFLYDSTSSGQERGICLYLIQSTLLVLLQLSDLNVPSSPNCNNAYIKVYDGVSQSSPVLLGKTCGSGSGPVPPLISSGNFFLIEIGNSKPSALSTFTASYETVRYGGTFETDNGVVTSPEFTNPYPKNVDVVYSIIAPEGYKVSLTFYIFSTQYSPNCSIDYLTLLDGPLMTSPILATYCGGLTIPTSVVSSGNVMILHFHSGDSAGHNGFYAKYTFVTPS